MHPTGGFELTHGGVDNRNAGAPFFPGFKVVTGLVPQQRFGFFLERPAHTYSRVVVEDVDVEVPPGDLVDPGFDDLAGSTGLPGGNQALAPGQDAAGQVWR